MKRIDVVAARATVDTREAGHFKKTNLIEGCERETERERERERKREREGEMQTAREMKNEK
jgi:hypothetical protein